MRPFARVVALLALVTVAADCAAPAPTPFPSPVSTAPSSQDVAGWQLSSLDKPARSGSVADIVLVHRLFIAVGTVDDRPTAWTSPDGVSWSAEFLPGAAVSPSTVIDWQGRVLALGGGEAGRCAHPFAITTWRRNEAGPWAGAPFDSLFCAGGQPAVAGLDDRAVIVGTGTGDVPYAWTSGDGLRWKALPGAFPGGAPRALTTDTAGGFIATGSGPANPWVARWPAGGGLQRPEPLPAPAGSTPITAVTLDSNIFIAVVDPSGAAGLLASTDGVSWAAILAEGLEGAQIARIVAASPVLVAIGGNEAGPALWVADPSEARRWRPVALPGGEPRPTFIAGVAVLENRVVLVGTIEVDGRTFPAAWVGPASLLAP